jgi:hypothetical protein
MRFALRRAFVVCATLALLAGACAAPVRTGTIAVPPPQAPLERDRLAARVGDLLSADPVRSLDAERRLSALDDAERRTLAEVAATIPHERDPRWLNVLDENHALPALSAEERLDFLLWKSARVEPFYAMKAQSRLLDLARERPEVLEQRLARPGPQRPDVAIALALAHGPRRVPALVAFYRDARTVAERRGAAEAIALAVGEERRPRPDGTPVEVARDADAVERWWRSHGG